MNTIEVPLKAGIIGFGKVGKIRHECVQNNPNLELMGVCDIDPEVGRYYKKIYFNNYKILLSEQPDIIFVCTYNSYIPEITCEAISRGIHVFSEKPPGRTLSDVKRIYEAAMKNPKVKVKFGFNHRYHQSIIEAKAIVDGGRLGKVLWVRGIYGKAGGPGYENNWRNNYELSGGGILIDQGIHMIDLFRYFTGEYDEVKSFVSQSYWHVGVEDNVFALLRNSESGQMAMLHSSATQWRHKFLFEIYLEKGYLEIDGILSSTGTYGRETLKMARCSVEENGYQLPNPQENLTLYDNDNSWSDEVSEFIDCIMNNKPIPNGSVYDAVKTMELIENIYNNDKPIYSARIARHETHKGGKR